MTFATVARQDARVTDIDAGPFRGAGATQGIAALLAAMALLVLPAVVALVDPDVLSLRHDAAWLGSPIMRFAALQTVAMLVPFTLGVLAVWRNRGRDYGVMAALVAVLGNFLLLRAVLALLVTAVLV
jgi:hypothetical protein